MPQFTAFFHWAPNPAQPPDPVVIEAPDRFAAWVEAQAVLDQWESDNPQPNGQHPLTLVCIEIGTRPAKPELVRHPGAGRGWRRKAATA